MLRQATTGGYAVGAFNVTSLVQLKAVVETAEARRAPVIVQFSVSPVRYFGPECWAAAGAALARAAQVPVCLHLDHCTEASLCRRCAEAGFTNIMVDGSHADFEGNIRLTREVAEFCHAFPGISVEGELGTVSGVEDQVRVAESEAELCDPARAREFVERTGVDLFAPAIGTAHGIYRTENPRIDFDRLDRIRREVNGDGYRAALVIHGGTGLKPEVVRRLVELGGAKFNVSTDLKHALIDASWDYLARARADYHPGRLDQAVEAATRARLEYWMDLLGATGRAGPAA